MRDTRTKNADDLKVIIKWGMAHSSQAERAIIWYGTAIILP